MYDSVNTGRRGRRWAGAAGLLAAGAISGGILATALSASARTCSSPPEPSKGTSPTPTRSSRSPPASNSPPPSHPPAARRPPRHSAERHHHDMTPRRASTGDGAREWAIWVLSSRPGTSGKAGAPAGPRSWITRSSVTASSTRSHLQGPEPTRLRLKNRLISVHRQGRRCSTERVVLGHWQGCAELGVRSIGSRRYGG